ncbi:monooxygenase [Novosphingobium barchaimii]|nr:monooxygenase [Novosphingobium barchaimii]
MTQTTIDPADFRRVLGNYPTGVCVITAMDADNRPAGMVVGSFTSVSLDPPLVGFFPDKRSTSWPMIKQAGHFCVNVLGIDQQDVCRAVTAKGDEKFVGVEYVISDHNLPVISNSLACIECRLYSVTEAGDHWFVMGEVLRMESVREEGPMLFHRGKYGAFAEVI